MDGDGFVLLARLTVTTYKYSLHAIDGSYTALAACTCNDLLNILIAYVRTYVHTRKVLDTTTIWY